MFRLFRKIRDSFDRIAAAYERMADAQERIADASVETHLVSQKTSKAIRDEVESESRLIEREPNRTEKTAETNKSKALPPYCYVADYVNVVRLFLEQAVTISKRDNVVTIECPDGHDASEMLEWLNRIGVDDFGDPAGAKIAATGDDGSVLCEFPNGRRVRFWFMGRPFDREGDLPAGQ